MSEEKTRLEALVARILTDRDLVLNKGATHGVEVGMRFAILADEGIGIVDPKTGEQLGDVERPKTLVKVTQVQEKLAVASTYRARIYGGGALYSSPITTLFAPPRKVPERLRADEHSYARPLKPEESIVNVGDRAVQVIGEEFSGWDW